MERRLYSKDHIPQISSHQVEAYFGYFFYSSSLPFKPNCICNFTSKLARSQERLEVKIILGAKIGILVNNIVEKCYVDWRHNGIYNVIHVEVKCHVFYHYNV